MSKEAMKLALEALEEIALAGMSGSGQESEEGMTAWHARQAWKFIGIAARALTPIKEALAKQEHGKPVAIIHRNEYNKYRLEPHDCFDIKSIPFNVDVSLFKSPQQRTWERPWASLTDGQADNLIANLEPLLDAKNQSWANAEKMLIDILAAVPQGSDK